jgi:Flp pilus assembly protein TadG
MSPRADRGQSLVEVAFVLPVLLIILLAIFDGGRAVYAYNTLSNAAREATRTAIVDQNPSVIETEAESSALGLDPTSLVTTFSSSCTSPYKIGCPATVSITYSWTPITPLIGQFMGAQTVTATAEMPIERVYTSP